MDTPRVKKPTPVEPSFVRKDDRGHFIEIVNEGPWETIIHGSMKKGKTMGNHYHRECRAFFYLISGKAEVRIRHLIDNTFDTVSLKAGQGICFLPFEVHKVYYLEDSDFILLKSYRYRDDAPDIFPDAVD
jgi:quercetin dioxygenase-like cupin family protein